MNLEPEGPKIELLDHGYIQLIEHWGADERIIEAARMSTDKGFKGWGPQPATDPTAAPAAGDEKLLRYLYEHHHDSPFEFAGAIVEIQAPIIVFREWHRHRTQSYAEMSARYTPLPDFNYMPTPERCLMVSGTNKQAGAVTGGLTHGLVLIWLDQLAELYEHAEQIYQNGLAFGIPKEIARLPVPVARYSRMRAQANLRNWLAFLTLRMDPAAQWEIRQYANTLCEILRPVFPRTMELFMEKRT